MWSDVSKQCWRLYLTVVPNNKQKHNWTVMCRYSEKSNDWNEFWYFVSMLESVTFDMISSTRYWPACLTHAVSWEFLEEQVIFGASLNNFWPFSVLLLLSWFFSTFWVRSINNFYFSKVIYLPVLFSFSCFCFFVINPPCQKRCRRRIHLNSGCTYTNWNSCSSAS